MPHPSSAPTTTRSGYAIAYNIYHTYFSIFMHFFGQKVDHRRCCHAIAKHLLIFIWSFSHFLQIYN